MKKYITVEESKWVGNLLGANWINFTPEHFRDGLDAELKLRNFNTAGIVTSKDLMITGKIALANLNVHQDYYCHPEKMEVKQNELSRLNHIHYAVDASIDSIVDSPFTETYQSDYKENRRKHRNLLLDK